MNWALVTAATSVLGLVATGVVGWIASRTRTEVLEMELRIRDWADLRYAREQECAERHARTLNVIPHGKA